MAWVDIPPTSWTPTITQSGTVTKTVNYATYQRSGSWVSIVAGMTMTGAGTAANAIIVGNLPIAIANFTSGLTPIGTGLIQDISVAAYQGFCIPVSTTSFATVSVVTTSSIGAAPSFALASGDIVTFTIHYQVA